MQIPRDAVRKALDMQGVIALALFHLLHCSALGAQCRREALQVRVSLHLRFKPRLIATAATWAWHNST